MQFVEMYAGHPHLCIKAVSLAEIHPLQVRFKQGSLLSSSAVLILLELILTELVFVHFLKDIGRCTVNFEGHLRQAPGGDRESTF